MSSRKQLTKRCADVAEEMSLRSRLFRDIGTMFGHDLLDPAQRNRARRLLRSAERLTAALRDFYQDNRRIFQEAWTITG
jgi:hypothetical protein